MKCTEETIRELVDIYNQVTKAHKRPPVMSYVEKKLSAGEPVEIVSGHPRWSSALRLTGTPDAMQAEFVINQALPEGFKKHLEPMRDAFNALIAENLVFK